MSGVNYQPPPFLAASPFIRDFGLVTATCPSMRTYERRLCIGIRCRTGGSAGGCAVERDAARKGGGRPTGGSTPAEATRRYVDGLASAAPHALDRGVTILVEALPRAQCDVVLTLAEAAGIVREIGSPAIRTMFDTHNAVDEVEPHAALVEKYFDLIRHVHVNEMDGGHPGTDTYDFRPVLDTLRRRDYRGWVSLEAFDFTPGAERIANDSLRYLEARIAELPS